MATAAKRTCHARPSIMFSKYLIALLSFFQSPCSSSPCQNEAACVTNYRDDTFECLCKNGFFGDYCEKGRFIKCLLESDNQ